MSVGRVRNTQIPASPLPKQEACQRNRWEHVVDFKARNTTYAKNAERARCEMQNGSCRLQHAEDLIES